MSRTELKHGNAVWDAACHLLAGEDVFDGVWVTAGEVARQANVSKNTARKYLDAAVEVGRCHRFRHRGKGAIYYRTIEAE